jgi:hypothetical protein
LALGFPREFVVSIIVNIRCTLEKLCIKLGKVSGQVQREEGWLEISDDGPTGADSLKGRILNHYLTSVLV